MQVTAARSRDPPSLQELVDKAPLLPPDIQWHFIGHLQSNKVKAVIGEWGGVWGGWGHTTVQFTSLRPTSVGSSQTSSLDLQVQLRISFPCH